MSERRPFPPSPRQLALARAAGLSSASPLIVGAIACGAALAVTVLLARAAATTLGAWIAAACDSHATSGALDSHATSGALDSHATSAALDSHATSAALDSHATSAALALDHLGRAVLELALPLLVAAAIAALIAHVAQTRAFWMPRRRIDNAPEVPRAAGVRGAFEFASAAVVGAVTFGWLWITAPRLAALFETRDATAGIGAALASLVVTLAIAWLVLGVVDALLRRAQLAGALAMTATEKREDDRLAAADPRWARRRRELWREPAAGPAVARAAVVLLGDDLAVAIAWDAVRQPVPLRTATGRRARATQLVGLARRYRVAVHRDAALAAELVGGDGPVPEAHWARLAEIVAAVRAH